MLLSRKLLLVQPDCTTFPCREECCGAGCDVWPHERAALLDSGLAREQDFTGPYDDDEGDRLFRTALGPRGCTFLGEPRGCRLHHTGLKPSVCVLVPRDRAEADEMAEDRMLPCRAAWDY
jgi:hypothetical protein